MPIPLNEGNLTKLSRLVTVPNYDRSRLIPNVAHIGVGAFHRAHQAVYLDDVLSHPELEPWCECGIGLRPSDGRIHSLLEEQESLYTLIERGRAGETARIIGSIVQYVRAHEEKESALRILSSPAIRLVSLTVTEGGYFTDPATGKFDEHHPALKEDLEHPHNPSTMLGLLAEALVRRRKAGIAPFTLLSCDNVQHNGDVLRRVLSTFAGLRDAKLGAWIEREVAFPNCMVDRITPATTDDDIQSVSERFGIEAGWPVITEPFRQWVIEDRFPNGRPEWEKLGPGSGLLLTTAVAGYELMKMRLLNGGHSALAYLGLLLQYHTIAQVMDDSLMRAFLDRYFEQVSPLVPALPGIDLTEYKRQLVDRFSNPFMADRLTRIAGDGSSKLTKWIMPSVSELLRHGAPIDSLALIVGAWFQCLVREVKHGQEFTIMDSRKEWLQELVAGPRGLNRFLQERSLFTEDLRQSALFQKVVVQAVNSLETEGVEKAMHLLTHNA